MRVFSKKPASYADLVALPDGVLGQIVDGELIASPRPSLRHARASVVLSADLSGPFDRGRGGPGGWWFLFEPELHLGSDVVVPDLAGWKRDRLPRIPPEPTLSLAPDWLCEVLSPGTAGFDRVRKMRVYAREAVRHVWLVDPEEQTLEIFRLTGNQLLGVATFAGAERVRAEPFEAIELDLAFLWT